MDKNTITGFALIGVLLICWSYFTSPSAEEIERQQYLQDSITIAQRIQDSLILAKKDEATVALEEQVNALDTITNDTLKQALLGSEFGAFSTAMAGKEEAVVLKNKVFTVNLTNKGGHITSVELNDYKKWSKDKKGKTTKVPLLLLEDKKNRFEYTIPIKGANRSSIKTSELYFEKHAVTDKSVSFRAKTSNGGYIEQKYTLDESTYMIDYDVNFVGMDKVIPTDAQQIKFNWDNYLDALEKNASYERNYSTIYYKELEDGPDNCSCTGEDEVNLEEKVRWVSNTQQFFNSTLATKSDKVGFSKVKVTTTPFEEGNEDLKKLASELYIPFGHSPNETMAMQLYIGPNKFNDLAAYNMDLEDIIPFGQSIFGAINKWIIRPSFNFLSGFIGSAGLIILVLTFFIKLALYPLSYKMLKSQSKMAVLKPEIEAVKKKMGEDADPQKVQMETMKLYQETGVNPLGGCMPMLLQMPIWFALYRFFPAAIEFRQASFLWADDLSSYDSIWTFGEVPLLATIYGDHISLFTILWAGTTVIYSYYNSKHMDMGANPMMKYVQYFMPLMFIFFFNNFASGLTCYLLFSNILNIAQTIITKNIIIDNEKLRQELQANKKKPKKKGGFQARLQAALKEQQEAAKKQEAAAKKRKEDKKTKRK